jgi:hypothetical protein
MVFQSDQSIENDELRAQIASGLAKPPLPSPAAARYIGMSDSWLRQTRMEGRSDGPPFLRMGARTVRYLPTDLDKWLEERRRSVHMAPAAAGAEARVPGARSRGTAGRPPVQKRRRRRGPPTKARPAR